MALIVGDVHFLDEFGIDYVIGVENEISVESLGIVFLDLLKEEVQGIALADVLVAVALIDNGASPSGDLCGPVVAMVGADEDLYLLVGIVLVIDAVDEVADNEFLVAGTDQESIGIFDDLFLGRGILFAEDLVPDSLEKRYRNVEKLARVADGKKERQEEIDAS